MRKYIYLLLPLLLLMMSPCSFSKRNSSQLLQQGQHSTKKWWFSAGYNRDEFDFNTVSGPSFVNSSGDTNFYHVMLSKLFTNYHLIMDVSYNRLSTNSKSVSSIGAVNSNDSSEISGNLFGINIKKIWMEKFYLGIYGDYGPTHTNLSAVNNRTSGDAGSGSTSFNGDLWDVGAETGFICPIGNDWIFDALLQFIYIQTYNDPYTLTLTNLPVVSQTSSTISTENLLQDISVHYLITDHVRPFFHFGFIEVLGQDLSNPRFTSVTTVPIPELLLKNFGYRVGGGLEVISHNIQFDVGYFYNKRGSTFHSHFAYVSLSVGA